MKKLEKLKLHDLKEIGAEDQKSILGGSGSDGWNFMLAPDGNWYSYPGGDAYVYGSAPGFITNICDLKSREEAYNVSSFEVGLGSIAAGVVSFFAGGITSVLFLGASVETACYAIFEDGQADKLNDIIYQLQSMGYNCESEIRYSNSGGQVKIWDKETGQLILEY